MKLPMGTVVHGENKKVGESSSLSNVLYGKPRLAYLENPKPRLLGTEGEARGFVAIAAANQAASREKNHVMSISTAEKKLLQGGYSRGHCCGGSSRQTRQIDGEQTKYAAIR